MHDRPLFSLLSVISSQIIFFAILKQAIFSRFIFLPVGRKIHKPIEYDFENYFGDFLENSPFLPVNVEPSKNKKRITFINIENRLCENYFQFSNYFLPNVKRRDLGPYS